MTNGFKDFVIMKRRNEEVSVCAKPVKDHADQPGSSYRTLPLVKYGARISLFKYSDCDHTLVTDQILVIDRTLVTVIKAW